MLSMNFKYSSCIEKLTLVRFTDYIGGHIFGSTNVPSHTLDYKMPELVRKLKDKDIVVFHCALSQQRGPGAALRYLREKERLLGVVPKISAAPEGDQVKEQGSGKKESEETQVREAKEQKVYVLDRGFVGWQERYGEDQRLTEGYSKELWKDGYWM